MRKRLPVDVSLFHALQTKSQSLITVKVGGALSKMAKSSFIASKSSQSSLKVAKYFAVPSIWHIRCILKIALLIFLHFVRITITSLPDYRPCRKTPICKSTKMSFELCNNNGQQFGAQLTFLLLADIWIWRQTEGKVRNTCAKFMCCKGVKGRVCDTSF